MAAAANEGLWAVLRGVSAAKRWTVVWITLAASCHFFAYEFIRAASTTLFTTAFGSSHLPVALTVVPVVTVVMLAWYHRMIHAMGPYATLMLSTVACVGVLAAAAVVVQSGSTSAPYAAFALFVFRQAYVTFLASQYWSRVSTCLRHANAAVVFGPVFGITSIFSTLGGAGVSASVTAGGGEAGAIWIGAAALAASLPAAHLAYAYRLGDEDTAVTGGANSRDHKPSPGVSPTAVATPVAVTQPPCGVRVWKRVGLGPVLVAPSLPWLLYATMAMQVLATFVSLLFNSQLYLQHPQPSQRSAFTGQFFALVNFIAAALQLLGVPLLFRTFPLHAVLAFMPAMVGLACAVAATVPGLYSAAMFLLAFKVTEYALFAAAREAVYNPLSFEARYVAKEIIDVFGYRAGKGGTSFVLAALVLLVPAASPTPYGLNVLAACATAVWCYSILRLRRCALRPPYVSPP